MHYFKNNIENSNKIHKKIELRTVKNFSTTLIIIIKFKKLIQTHKIIQISTNFKKNKNNLHRKFHTAKMFI